MTKMFLYLDKNSETEIDSKNKIVFMLREERNSFKTAALQV